MHENRQIFSYWDGTYKRDVDPLEVGGILEDACPDFADLIAGLEAPKPSLPPGAVADEVGGDRKDAQAKLLSATRKAFGVKPFAGVDGKREGLTQTETFDLLTDFLVFMGGLGREARPFASSPQPDTPSTPPDSPTEYSADFGLPEESLSEAVRIN